LTASTGYKRNTRGSSSAGDFMQIKVSKSIRGKVAGVVLSRTLSPRLDDGGRMRDVGRIGIRPQGEKKAMVGEVACGYQRGSR
jgi:hypothetical protein